VRGLEGGKPDNGHERALPDKSNDLHESFLTAWRSIRSNAVAFQIRRN
jgi:hypothetical protein